MSCGPRLWAMPPTSKIVPICVPCLTRHHMRNDLASILTSHSSKNLVILFGFSIRNRIHQNWMSARSYIPLFGMRRPKGHKICIMMLLKSHLWGLCVWTHLLPSTGLRLRKVRRANLSLTYPICRPEMVWNEIWLIKLIWEPVNVSKAIKQTYLKWTHQHPWIWCLAQVSKTTRKP